MNKIKQQMRRAKKVGMSPIDVLQMREIAKKEAEKMENRMADRAFLYMLAVPLNVLVNDYWPKTAKKKAPQFIDDVLSLWDSVCEGYVTDQELSALLEEFAGVKLDVIWEERNNARQ